MTLRFSLLNFCFLALTHGLFIHLTSASQTVQPWLHGAFLIAFAYYLICFFFLRRKTKSVKQILSSLTIAGLAFYSIWSIGIIVATRIVANPTAAHVHFLYGTSSVQFLEYNNNTTLFFLLAFVPPFLLNILSNVVLKKWLFPKKQRAKL